ncbi:hypothetical protein EF888_13470 [Silicimonas algicola]|uniref:Membrane-bound lysozyme inhibitor of c-type lysozyme MliC n=1 Tax=Silicimonas algicola TaxID=1826607 RepID=A0A316GBX2_9RHOB|nr:hypothetical protein [Silicimonas algicola]AZQ68055.1 hypothetical protein EF888_13470 [Silicimonas algicola]PWK57496.1 hypothetical protein C8D95_102139 [Silicimonas algicola]
MRLSKVAILCCAVLMLPGCGVVRGWFNGSGVAADALPYRARLAKGDDARDLRISVNAPGATVDMVRESVRFEATRYCLETFGGSDAAWVTDPATGDWSATRDGDALVFAARCTAR